MNSTVKSPATKTRKKIISSFQELNLFFTEVEIIHQYKVYCTETTQFFLQLKKPQCDSIKQRKKSVFLRFSQNEPNRIQKDDLPKSVSISINNCNLTLNSKSKSKHWKCPLDITNYIRPVTTRNANSIQIYLNHSKTLLSKGFGLELVLAKKLTIGEQIQMLLLSDLYTRKTDDALKIIKNHWTSSDDVECQTMRVPLTCSVTKTMIQLPLVGSKCKHVACFEGQTFLEMNLDKPEWICPVCSNLIRKNELRRDLLCAEILNSTQRKVDTIEFDKLGNYKPAEPERATPKQKSKKIECIVLNDLDDLGNELDNFTNATSTNLNDLLTPKLEQLPTFNQNDSNNLSSILIPSCLNNNFTLNSTSNLGSSFQSSPRSRDNSAVNEIIDVSDNGSVIVLDSDSDTVISADNSNNSDIDMSDNDSDTDMSREDENDSDVSCSETLNSSRDYSYLDFNNIHQSFSSNASNTSNSDTEDISSVSSQSSLNSSISSQDSSSSTQNQSFPSLLQSRHSLRRRNKRMRRFY